MSFFTLKKEKTAWGFTIVELIVSVAIFAFMTAFLVAKYGTFNDSVLLTNLAYDVALTIRNAQTYGLNVKSKPGGGLGYSGEYQYAYGVHFDMSGQSTPKDEMIFFADVNGNNKYNGLGNEEIARYKLRGGSFISNICVGTSEYNCTNSNMKDLDISFLRPDPTAIFGKENSCGTVNGVEKCKASSVKYAEITISSPRGDTRKVIVRSTGQIAVLQGQEGETTPTWSPSASASSS